MQKISNIVPCGAVSFGLAFTRGASHCPRARQTPLGSPTSAPAYLEAYDLMEENADVIFEVNDMMSEREYDDSTIDNTTLGEGLPRPASQLPGPRSWPLVGCLPYMLRHPGELFTYSCCS